MEKKQYYTIQSPTKLESIAIRSMILIGVLSLIAFFIYFFRPDHIGYIPLFILLAFVFVYGAWRKLYLWYHYFSIKVPKRPVSKKVWKVDVLTTYFPGEPYDMVLNTLAAIRRINYPHTAYLCDEANDPYLIEECKKLGVVHVTRDNRINAKAGNINNALQQAKGEICVILDPDHIPKPTFLESILPHFENDKIGFVQIVQGYYNKYDTLVARGAAEQTFQFYGPMMMCMNSYGTVNAIGANCTFRREALNSIGGHAPGLAEDMHTAMLLHAKGWKSVYVPEFLAKGLVPADLTSYYKQQLKWSRGTFELLYSTYPKLVSDFTLRQKIHYALMPFHYFIGFIYLISFLIPILSLTLAKMPWTGNILHFIAMSAPVFLSSLLIRTYVQKWVIEENERGFHVIGGILQIVSWWIYLLGIVYTVIRKKVPYLPTPKDEQSHVNFSLLLPNLIIGLLSIIAVVYGLNKDLTPFSLVMSFFALLNAFFMFFSFYLASSTTNRNKILRNNLKEAAINKLSFVKKGLRRVANGIFILVRPLALPLLILGVLLSILSLRTMKRNQWENIKPNYKEVKDFRYMGIFEPKKDNGLSSLPVVDSLQNASGLNFNLASFYWAWQNENDSLFKPYLSSIIENGYTPLLTWEPWSSGLTQKDSIIELQNEERVLYHIANGAFDDYIREMAKLLKEANHPIFLRFAHEFDNPFYPWSNTGKNTTTDFIAAWRHVYGLFDEVGAKNVLWVWNPWHKDNVLKYYPGSDYVDWLGLNILNYGAYNNDGEWYSFNQLYQPFRDLQKNIEKPVLLTEFGTLKVGGDQTLWLDEAFQSIDSTYSEIKGLVFFNSSLDDNLPANHPNSGDKMDWSINFSQENINKWLTSSPGHDIHDINTSSVPTPVKNYPKIALDRNFKGVIYRKPENWRTNRYIASKEVLEKDFKLMNDIGVNLISVQPSKIYEQNLLKYAEKAGLKVLYNFQIPNQENFLTNSLSKRNFIDNLLNAIEDLKKNKVIVGWQLTSQEKWQREGLYGYLSNSFTEQAYIAFIRELVDSIKEKDSERFVGLELKPTGKRGLNSLLLKFHDNQLNIDAIGLSIDKSEEIVEYQGGVAEAQIPWYISDIKANDYIETDVPLSERAVILSSWQNTNQDWKVGFDGLLDFKGRKTSEYFELGRSWAQSTMEISTLPAFEIIRPAIPLVAGAIVDYHVVFKKENQFYLPGHTIEFQIEWQLIKKDKFGNHLAIQQIGVGPSIEFTLPKDPNSYDIRVNVTDGKISTSSIINLNTPFIN